MTAYFHLRPSFALIAGVATIAMAMPAVSGAQDHKGGGEQHGGGSAPRPQEPRSGGGAPRPQNTAHANREPVRTWNFTPQPGRMPERPGPPQLPEVGSNRAIRRTLPPKTNQVKTQIKFTTTPQGRRYDNGLILRKGVAVSAAWQKRYFPKGHFHFPRYYRRWQPGVTLISPFGFYFGICAPFISVDSCYDLPPQVAFVDEPTYVGDNWSGFADGNDPNYLNDPNLATDAPGLSNAMDQLSETFQDGDIDGLVSLINPSMKVAIYEEGAYKYSMDSNDFVDLTRDAIQAAQTVSFTITYLHQRAPDIFSVCAQHVYHDDDGGTRTVYASFVLQDIGGLWTLTQVETSPDITQTPAGD